MMTSTQVLDCIDTCLSVAPRHLVASIYFDMLRDLVHKNILKFEKLNYFQELIRSGMWYSSNFQISA